MRKISGMEEESYFSDRIERHFEREPGNNNLQDPFRNHASIEIKTSPCLLVRKALLRSEILLIFFISLSPSRSVLRPIKLTSHLFEKNFTSPDSVSSIFEEGCNTYFIAFDDDQSAFLLTANIMEGLIRFRSFLSFHLSPRIKICMP